MKRLKIVLGCLLPLLLVVGGSWWGIRRMLTKVPKPPATATVSRGIVEIKVTETGTIEPLTKVDVKSKVAGRIASMLVDEGDLVAAGQLLAEIDPTEINSQVDQMRAQLQGSRARLSSASTGVRYQREQTSTGVQVAEQSVASAQSQVEVAEEESRSQPSLTEADIRQAEASLRSSRAALDLLRTATQPQALVAAQTGLTEAQTASANAQRQLARQNQLLARGFVAQQQVDAAGTEAVAARARLDQAQKRIDVIKEQQRLEVADAEERVAQAEASLARARAARTIIKVKEQQLVAARAALQQAKAQLVQARASRLQDSMRGDDVAQARSGVDQIVNQLTEIEVRQRDTRLIAPMAGVITHRYLEKGELVTSGVSTFSSGTPVFQVADLSTMLVKATVNEVDVHKVRLGLPVEIHIDGARGVVFQGRVTKVAPAAFGGTDAASQAQGAGGVVRFSVQVTVTRPDPRLRPGMSARCTIIMSRRSGVLRLPSDAVEGAGDKASVQVAGKPDPAKPGQLTYTKRTIRAGLRGDTFIEVVSGLKEGEKVKPGVYTGPKRQGVDFGPKPD
ncbi:MAG: HlyD family efflux transporter periplasmic adaptor subunit [Armatimonadetes bacterium]|nr:HlyD family efflux transporter periplasmic adaptor subunit [Armatimonadota bacterium]